MARAVVLVGAGMRGISGWGSAADFSGGGWTRAAMGLVGEAAGFVGVEVVIADGLLAFGRDGLNGGGEKVGGFEDFEIAFGVPTAAGAVNDGFGVGIPCDFLEGKGGAQ